MNGLQYNGFEEVGESLYPKKRRIDEMSQHTMHSSAVPSSSFYAIPSNNYDINMQELFVETVKTEQGRTILPPLNYLFHSLPSCFCFFHLLL